MVFPIFFSIILGFLEFSLELHVLFNFILLVMACNSNKHPRHLNLGPRLLQFLHAGNPSIKK